MQLMRHFEKDLNLHNAKLLEKLSPELSSLVQNLNDPKTTEEVGTDDEAFLVIARISIPSNLAWPCDTTCFCKFPAYSATKMFSSEDLELLLSTYKVMHPTINFAPADIPFSVIEYSTCFLGSEKFGCISRFRAKKYSYVLASSLSENVVDIVPGQIQRIFTHR